MRQCACPRDGSTLCSTCRGYLLRANGVVANAFAALPPMTEKQLQSQVMAVAANLGMLSYHTWSSKRSTPGYPDVTLVKPASPGRHESTLYLLELKIDTETPTLAQQRWLDALARVTHVVSGVVQPRTLAQWVKRIQEDI